MNAVCYQYFDGGGGSQPDDPDHPMTTSDLNKPGILFRWTKELGEEYKELLDDMGSSGAYHVNTELYSIINEEITAYLGNACTAEECAKRVKSRVSIWLSEHK